jgi:hypothetical protein
MIHKMNPMRALTNFMVCARIATGRASHRHSDVSITRSGVCEIHEGPRARHSNLQPLDEGGLDRFAHVSSVALVPAVAVLGDTTCDRRRPSACSSSVRVPRFSLTR